MTSCGSVRKMSTKTMMAMSAGRHVQRPHDREHEAARHAHQDGEQRHFDGDPESAQDGRAVLGEDLRVEEIVGQRAHRRGPPAYLQLGTCGVNS